MLHWLHIVVSNAKAFLFLFLRNLFYLTYMKGQGNIF